jgi:hypothetical protein
MRTLSRKGEGGNQKHQVEFINEMQAQYGVFCPEVSREVERLKIEVYLETLKDEISNYKKLTKKLLKNRK